MGLKRANSGAEGLRAQRFTVRGPVKSMRGSRQGLGLLVSTRRLSILGRGPRVQIRNPCGHLGFTWMATYLDSDHVSQTRRLDSRTEDTITSSKLSLSRPGGRWQASHKAAAAQPPNQKRALRPRSYKSCASVTVRRI